MINKLICLVSLCGLVSCMGSKDSILKVHKSKGSGSGSAPINSKPIEEATKAGVFFDFSGNELGVVSSNDKVLVLGARFSINGRDSGYRRMMFPLGLGGRLQVDNREYDLTNDSELRMDVMRFEIPKTKKQYLAVDYRFLRIQQTDSGGEIRTESRRLLLMEAVPRPKPKQILSDFQFPRDKDLSLEKWVESKIKKD